MLPTITIIGRPNVGKSTLFNCLTQSRTALVSDFPGLTRDRLYGECRIGKKAFVVIDTGGLESEDTPITSLMFQQTKQALQDSDLILFVVDARSGLIARDQEIADFLRTLNKKIMLVVNKIDNADPDIVTGDFYSLGFGETYPISAVQKQGIDTLVEEIEKKLPAITPAELGGPENTGIKIAVVGRPNVGKSTLINRLLGEERVVVFDQPGTTRDSIYIPYERRGKNYILIDTAGVRRKRGVTEGVEKFSVIKTLQAIESCNVVVYVIDAQESVSEQDLHLLGFILQVGKALVIAVNKWDGLPEEQREKIRQGLDRRLVFVDFAKIKFISALHGTGVGELYPFILKAYDSAMRKLSTPELTRILEKAIELHQPPLVSGRRIKLRYAHPGGHNPPVIVIHGKQVKSLPESYRRYLVGIFRKKLKLSGTPIRIEFREGENPFVNN